MAEKETKKVAAKKTPKGAKAAAKKTTPAKGSATVAQYALLKRPIITEKTALLSVDRDRVAFKVPSEATKTEIRAAVQAIYGVDVAKVRTVNMLGKMKRAGASMGRRQGFKKAYVTIKSGQTIDVVEGL